MARVSPDRRLAFQVRSHLFVRVHELPDTIFVGCASLEERDELLAAEPETST